MRIIIFCIISVLLAILLLIVYFYSRPVIAQDLWPSAHTLPDIAALFNTTPTGIKKLTRKYIAQAKEALTECITIPAPEKSFANTIEAIDRIVGLSNVAIYGRVLEALAFLSPDKLIRQAAHEFSLEINLFFVDMFSNNIPLYNACIAYIENNSPKEHLTEAQRYFMQAIRKEFERNGLNLPDEKREQVVSLQKELTGLILDFEKNIAQDNRTITASTDDLPGVDDEFVQTLKQNDDGLYIIRIDQPTMMRIMTQCTKEQTRERFYKAFVNRAYPENELLLKSIIQKRDELAKLLGFESYAAYDLDEQMAKSPDRAYNFLRDLYKRSYAKEQAELQRLLHQLPEGVTLAAEGKIKPWDLEYLKTMYKKNSLNLDEQHLAEYFPAEKTISGLFDIYQKFFGITFQEVPAKNFWHPEVKALQIYKKNTNQLLGTILLDLYPRDNKYSHAAHLTVIPSVYPATYPYIPDVSVVMANFPRAMGDSPALLMRKDVITFFHEFGHALHAVLSQSPFAMLSGTSVKRDFVEMPSQMLEEWLFDKDILRSLSSHYKTGAPLPDEIINTIITLKQFDSGLMTRAQIRYALLSLEYFASGNTKDVYTILADLYTSTAPEFFFEPENHFYASFGHLTGYGAKYYGYLWSKVFALDLFAEIKKHGLLNPFIGRRYADIILARGGTKDPQLLLIEFLGREPRIDAFMKDLGI